AGIGGSGRCPRLAHSAFMIDRLAFFTGGARVLVPGQQLTHPGNFLVIAARCRDLPSLGPRFLVAPMRRHAVFGKLMHVVSAYLDFEATALAIDHYGVQ